MAKIALGLTLFFVVLGAGVALFFLQQTPAQSGMREVGGAFSLVNHNGETVTQEHFDDRYKLVFFGFTHCPMVCPTELQKISKVLALLGPKSEEIYPLFVTVDPDRDSPEVIKEYLSNFDSRIIGLSGSQEQIDQAVVAFKAYAQKVQIDEDEYTMDHTAMIYLTNEDNFMEKLFHSTDNAETIATYIDKEI